MGQRPELQRGHRRRTWGDGPLHEEPGGIFQAAGATVQGPRTTHIEGAVTEQNASLGQISNMARCMYLGIGDLKTSGGSHGYENELRGRTPLLLLSRAPCLSLLICSWSFCNTTIKLDLFAPHMGTRVILLKTPSATNYSRLYASAGTFFPSVTRVTVSIHTSRAALCVMLHS